MKKGLTILLLSCIFLFLYSLSVNSDSSTSSLENLRTINDQEVVVGDDFFKSEVEFARVVNQLMMFATSQASLWGNNNLKTPIKVGLSSGGGFVYLYDRLERLSEPLKELYLVCTINKAQSMAFTFMLEFCDERLMLPDAQIMQHQIYALKELGGKRFDDDSKRLSLKYSDREAEVLGLDKKFWFSLTRGTKDKEFNDDELKMYKIATGFINKLGENDEK